MSDHEEHLGLRLQDVLPNVFEYFLTDDDRPSLRSACLVCRAWAAAGTRMLWREVTARGLERIAEPARRKLHAAEVQTLYAGCRLPTRQSSKNGHPTVASRLDGVNFPRLRHVSFRTDDGGVLEPGAINLGTYLQPRLEVLECHARALTADPSVSQRLAANCRQLRELRLIGLSCDFPDVDGDGQATDIAPQASTGGAIPVDDDDDCRRLLALLPLLPNVNAIVLEEGLFGSCNAHLFAYLAAYPRLIALHTGGVTSALLDQTFARVAQPFQALQRLHVDIETTALPVLVEAVPHVTELSLSVYNVYADGHHNHAGAEGDPWFFSDEPLPVPPALNCIAPPALSRLRSLHLDFPEPITLRRADIVDSLHELPAGQLRALSLSASVDTWITKYTDADFAALMARQPRLVSLTFTMACSTTPDVFRIAGEACRELEELALLARCYLSALDRAVVRPLFPRLRRLCSYNPDFEVRYWSTPQWR
jgi:hypothetical protein